MVLLDPRDKDVADGASTGAGLPRTDRQLGGDALRVVLAAVDRARPWVGRPLAAYR
jgi:hypothetical protein